MGDLEKMKAGLWLHAICPEIGGALLRTEELVFRLNQLPPSRREEREAIIRQLFGHVGQSDCIQIGRASCRERVSISVVAVSLKKAPRMKRTI